MRTTGLVLLLLVAGSSAVYAGHSDSFATDHAARQPRWQTVGAEMSIDEYRVAYRHNRRLAIDFMTVHSKRALASAGIPEPLIGVVGSAALLPVHDARFHLNSGKTLAVEVQDVMDEGRALLLQFRSTW